MGLNRGQPPRLLAASCGGRCCWVWPQACCWGQNPARRGTELWSELVATGRWRSEEGWLDRGAGLLVRPPLVQHRGVPPRRSSATRIVLAHHPGGIDVGHPDAARAAETRAETGGTQRGGR